MNALKLPSECLEWCIFTLLCEHSLISLYGLEVRAKDRSCSLLLVNIQSLVQRKKDGAISCLGELDWPMLHMVNTNKKKNSWEMGLRRQL